MAGQVNSVHAENSDVTITVSDLDSGDFSFSINLSNLLQISISLPSAAQYQPEPSDLAAHFIDLLTLLP